MLGSISLLLAVAALCLPHSVLAVRLRLNRNVAALRSELREDTMSLSALLNTMEVTDSSSQEVSSWPWESKKRLQKACDLAIPMWKKEAAELQKGIKELGELQLELQAEFESANSYVHECAASINAAFDSYGCAFPTNEDAVGDMEEKLRQTVATCVDVEAKDLGSYQGCFKNEDGCTAVRDNAQKHAGITYQECLSKAISLGDNNGADYFGMEYAEGFKNGKAECWFGPSVVLGLRQQFESTTGGLRAYKCRVDDAECEALGHKEPRLGAGHRTAIYSKKKLNPGRVRNFKDLTKWILAIRDRSAEIPNRMAEVKSHLIRVQNKLRKNEKLCSDLSWSNLMSHAFVRVVDLAKTAVERLGDIVVAMVDAIGCIAVDIGLSLLGAILDGILTAAFAVGSGGAFPAGLPYYPIMCLDISLTTGKKTTAVDKFTEKWTSASKSGTTLGKFTSAATVGTVIKQDMTGKVVLAAAKEGGKKFLKPEKIGTKVVSTVFSFSSEVERKKAHNGEGVLLEVGANGTAAVGLSMQDAVGFLFKAVISLLKTLGEEDCCKPLGKFLKKTSGVVDIIFWFVMRAWDALCGKFGTMIMEIIKQFALCNMCAVCPPDACTLTFLAFSDKCKEHYSSDAKAGGAGLLEVGNGAEVRQHDYDEMKEVETLEGNDGREDCHAWCLKQNSKQTGSKVVGAAGAEFLQVAIGSQTDFSVLEMFAESPLHAAVVTTEEKVFGGGQSVSLTRARNPCCPAGKLTPQSGKSSLVCNACKCRVAKESTAVRHGKVVVLFSPDNKLVLQMTSEGKVKGIQLDHEIGDDSIATYLESYNVQGLQHERFRIVGAGGGHVALYNTHFKRFVRMTLGEDGVCAQEASERMEWHELSIRSKAERFEQVVDKSLNFLGFRSVDCGKWLGVTDTDGGFHEGAALGSWEKWTVAEPEEWNDRAHDTTSFMYPYLHRKVAIMAYTEKRFLTSGPNEELQTTNPVSKIEDFNSICPKTYPKDCLWAVIPTKDSKVAFLAENRPQSGFPFIVMGGTDVDPEETFSVDIVIGSSGENAVTRTCVCDDSVSCVRCTSCITTNECCGDQFAFTFTETQVSINRIDSSGGWGQDLEIRCSVMRNTGGVSVGPWDSKAQTDEGMFEVEVYDQGESHFKLHSGSKYLKMNNDGTTEATETSGEATFFVIYEPSTAN